MPYTIGELAKRTGVTVRSLHHYDEFGLLTPSGRTNAGYRIYTDDDVSRLHKVLAYRDIGLPLKEILQLLQDDSPSLQEVLDKQIGNLQKQLQRQHRLLDRLHFLSARANTEEGVTAEDLIMCMAIMNMSDKYLDDREMCNLDQRRAELGMDKLIAIQRQWAVLIPAVQEQMEKNADPASPEVQTLAIRWLQLVRQVTGDQPEMMKKIGNMYQNESSLQKYTGISAEMIEFISAAFVISWPQRDQWQDQP